MLFGKNKLRFRDIKRTKEILSILRKNDLDILLVKTIGKDKLKAFYGTEEKEKEIGRRIKKACEELGPTFVKMGQVLSTRTELIPQNIADVLRTLQDSVTPFSSTQAKALIEAELKGKIEDIFDSFDDTPIASASVCQVYSAYLNNGEHVAVKVQRPNIEPLVKTDLEIISKLANFISKHTKYGKMYDFKGMVQEFSNAMEQELDFLKEAESTEKFGDNIAKHKQNVCAPKVKWLYTTKKVLTLEFVHGIKIDNIGELNRAGINKEQVATTLCTSLIKQILEDGFFHCDPHPGNLFVQEDGRVVFIDLGLVGKVSPRLRNNLSEMLLGITTQNTRKAAQAISAMDEAQASVNMKHFERTLDDYLNEYLYIPLKDINIADAFTSIFNLAGRYGMKIPKEFAMIAKCLGTAQGVIDALDKNVNIMSVAKKSAKSISLNYITSENFKDELIAFASDNLDVIKELPAFMLNFMRKMQDNDFSLDLNLKKTEKIEKNVEHMVNRISFSVILLAVCIVVAGLVISLGFNGGYVDPEIESLTFSGLRLGIITAVIIVLGIVISIFNSERKQHKK